MYNFIRKTVFMIIGARNDSCTISLEKQYDCRCQKRLMHDFIMAIKTVFMIVGARKDSCTTSSEKQYS